jgi:hypothetical protein
MKLIKVSFRIPCLSLHQSSMSVSNIMAWWSRSSVRNVEGNKIIAPAMALSKGCWPSTPKHDNKKDGCSLRLPKCSNIRSPMHWNNQMNAPMDNAQSTAIVSGRVTRPDLYRWPWPQVSLTRSGWRLRQGILKISVATLATCWGGVSPNFTGRVVVDHLMLGHQLFKGNF